MKFLLTLVACWGTDEHASLTSYVSNMDEAKNLVVGVVREKKLTRSEVIMAERIQLYVKPSNKDGKNVTASATNNKPFGYENEFKLRDSWDAFLPVPTTLLFLFKDNICHPTSSINGVWKLVKGHIKPAVFVGVES
ncbi:hypothetical protein Tco_1270761 [Tanacetum coccineum]